MARRPLEREWIDPDGGRRTTQLMRDSLGSLPNNMRRYHYLLAVLLPTLGSCSYLATFAVVNLSRERIRVTYSPLRYATPPAVKALRDLSHGDRPWIQLAVPSLGTDSATLTVELGPDSALRVATGTSYLGYDPNNPDWFGIGVLSINAPGGERTFRGREVLKAFSKRGHGIWSIDYQ